MSEKSLSVFLRRPAPEAAPAPAPEPPAASWEAPPPALVLPSLAPPTLPGGETPVVSITPIAPLSQGAPLPPPAPTAQAFYVPAGLSPAQYLARLDDEQRALAMAIDGPVRGIAGAGSGKTSTFVRRILHMVVQGIPPHQILATTFTKKAANEMTSRLRALFKDFGLPWAEGFAIGTMHSLASRICREYGRYIDLDTSYTIIDQDDAETMINRLIKSVIGKDTKVSDRDLLDAISYARNARVRLRDALEMKMSTFGSLFGAFERIADQYVEDKRNINVMDFDDLLEKWLELLEFSPEAKAAMQGRWRYVMMDEYQDTNTLQNEILRHLCENHRNIFVVGDDKQCLPGDTLIRTPEGDRPISQIREGDLVLCAAGHGRSAFGRVDKVFSRPVSESLYQIRLASGRTVRATGNHVGFARLPIKPGRHYVYLIHRDDLGYRIGKTASMAQTSSEGRCKDASGLKVRANQERADAAWVLGVYDSEQEAQRMEQILSLRYGVPQTMFVARGKLDEGDIQAIFAEGAQRWRVEDLMADFGLDPRFPHYFPQNCARGRFSRQQVKFAMFSGSRNMHRVSLETRDADVHDLVTTHAWRESKAGKKIEKNRASYDEALCVAEVLANEGGLEIRKSALMVDGDRAFPFLPVSSFRVGMEVPSYDGEAVVTDTIVEIVRLEAEPQTVWDLSVPEYRNFVADGVVVHNSIYAFRAANVENILTFEQRWPGCQTFYISSNYRSTPQIVAVGNSLIAKNSRQLPYVAQTPNANGMKPMVIRSENDGEQDRDIVEKITFYHEEHNVPYDEMMVLMRQNRQSIMLERDLVRAGIPYYKRGPQFWRSQHMKMVLAWVKLLQNPMEKLALARVVALYPGLGKKAIDDASKAIEKPEDFDRFMRGEIALGKAAGWLKCQEDLREIVEAYRSGAPRCLQESLGRLRAVAEPFILDMEKADSRLADVDTMLALAEGFEKVEDLLEEIALQDESSGSKENRVLLSTIHGVKGLECRIGFIMGMNEEIFPGNVTSLADLEEERRLAYVGITRPKEILIMYAPLMQTGTAGRKPGELTPSRFLDEIDPDLLIVKGTVS